MSPVGEYIILSMGFLFFLRLKKESPVTLFVLDLAAMLVYPWQLQQCFVDSNTAPAPPSAKWWVDNERILILGWTFPLRLQILIWNFIVNTYQNKVQYFPLKCSEVEVQTTTYYCLMQQCVDNFFYNRRYMKSWSKSVVLNLIGGTEPCKLHQCIHRTLRNWKNKIWFLQNIFPLFLYTRESILYVFVQPLSFFARHS